MIFDFYASTPWYADHLLPVYWALDHAEQGLFVQPTRSGLLTATAPSDSPPRPTRDRIAVVAANYDQKYYAANYRRVVRFEHGAGFSYHGDGTDHPSYAGGRSVTDNVVLLPATNRWVAEANARAFPEIASPLVGCPKLDALLTIPPPNDGTVAISFHWDCHVSPEARSAFWNYRRTIPDLVKKFRVIGHGHPRAWAMLSNWYPARGIEPVRDFEEVVRRADLYAVDSSSTLYEFAALDRPVVSLNAPWYRKDVHHGLRFWDRADVGVQSEGWAGLVDAVTLAFEDGPEQQRLRREATQEVYPYLGKSAARAVEILRSL